MNEKFQQAVVASRAGQIKEAQFLLAQSLKEEPDNADAWLLLSQLVDSKEKQQTYLEKALALNPDHELANEYRAELAAESDGETAVSAPIIPAPIVSAESDEIAELAAILDVDADDPLLGLEEADTDDWLAAAVAADSVTTDEDVESADMVESIDFAELMDEEDEETAVSTPTITKEKKDKVAVVVEKKTAVVDTQKAEREKKAAQLNYIIYGLIIIAILIALSMVYLFIA